MIVRGRERFRIAWSEKRLELLAKRRRCCHGGAFRLPFKRFSKPTSTTERQSRMVLMGRMFSHFMRMASSSLLSELFIRKTIRTRQFLLLHLQFPTVHFAILLAGTPHLGEMDSVVRTFHLPDISNDALHFNSSPSTRTLIPYFQRRAGLSAITSLS